MPILEATLYLVFAALTTAGLFLVGLCFRGRRTAIVLAACAVVFFAVLAAGLFWLIRAYGG